MIELSLKKGFDIKLSIQGANIDGEVLGVPQFDANNTANLNGIILKQKILQLSNNKWSITLEIINNRSCLIKLNYISVAKICELPFSNTAFENVVVHRLARQKNDIPGPFKPACQDRNMRDAAFCSAEVVAGGGISWNEFDSPDAILPTEFHADPAMVVSNENKEAFFIGFNGQTLHLSDIVISSNKERSKLKNIEAIAEFDGITLYSGDSCKTHELIIEYGNNPRDLFENHVGRIIKEYSCKVPNTRSVYCSWYYYGADIDANEVMDNLSSLKEKPISIDVFQIDMGWEDYFGDWQSHKSKFPNGMEVIANKIKEANYIPGIWTAPFVIEQGSMAAKKYPNIILRTKEGNPCYFKCDKGECYILDPFATEAEEFLCGFFSRLISWGYTYHKLDFMRAVFIHEDACFKEPNRTRAEAYRRGLELIRKAVGKNATINACGGLIEGSAGLADIIRLGTDLRGHWAPKGSSITAYSTKIKQNISRNFYQGLFMVDPDALQLRRNDKIWKDNPKNAHLSMGKFSDEEAFSIVVNQFLAGGIVCFSERLKYIDDDRRELFHKVMPAFSSPAKYFGKWDDYLPELYSNKFTNHPNLPDWNIVSVCNWNCDNNKTIEFKLSDVPDLVEAPKYAIFELKEQKFLGIKHKDEIISINVPTHGSRVLRVTPLNNFGKYLIGTNCNLSAGMELEFFSSSEQKLKSNIHKKDVKLSIFNYQDSIDELFLDPFIEINLK